MKTLISIIALSLSGSLFAADTAPAKKKATKTAPAKNPAADGLSIPADAKENADGTFSATDKDGKKWRYAKTPFGVMRSADTADATEPRPDPGAMLYVKAVDNGNTVTFVRQTPFGPIKSEKKKVDLTDAERQLLESQKAQQ